MARIQLLPEMIINQIAAGEVVDRPASIVKELVENSIDAKARNIVVKFNEGGTALLSVADDGIGMDAKDAALAFERNATSKLTQIKDLDNLSTFGFRGEAIASIASVGRVLMQTNDGSEGTEIAYDSGKKIYQKACSCKLGTFIEIRNLFEKIPARKQFLKSDATESMHIIRVVRAFILAEPDINFELYRNGKLVFSSPNSKDLESRTEILLGHFDGYTSLDYSNDRMKLTGILFEHAIDGIISKPDFLIFVNKRNVNHPAIVRVVRDTYSMVHARSVSVGAFLFLDFEGKFVDFNVHPQKKEVRFKNDYWVRKFIEDSVTDALQKKITKLTPLDPHHKIVRNPTALFEKSTWPLRSDIHLQKIDKNYFATIPGSATERTVEITAVDLNGAKSLNPVSGNRSSEIDEEPHACQVFELSCEQDLQNFPIETASRDPYLWKFIGTFYGERFAIFESNTGLVFVDLAAAQKCILLDQFLCNRGALPSQILLMPKVVSVDPEQTAAIDSLLPMFDCFGIGIENFGKNIYKITSLPREISEEMIINLLQDGSLTDVEQCLIREIFAKKICIHLPFRTLGAEEIPSFLGKLLRCQQFLVSPDDSNVLFEIDHCDFEKKFGLQTKLKKYHLQES